MSSYQIQEINTDIKSLSNLQSVSNCPDFIVSFLLQPGILSRATCCISLSHLFSFLQSRIALFYLSYIDILENSSHLFYGMAVKMSSSGPANFNNQVLINTHQDKILSKDIPGSMRSLMQREQEKEHVTQMRKLEAWYTLLIICGVKV